jgi:hypothetical protein
LPRGFFTELRGPPLLLALFPVRAEHLLGDIFRQIGELLIFLAREKSDLWDFELLGRTHGISFDV